MKILLSGGGTAGHAWPVVLVAQELKQNNHQVLYVGSRQGIEKKLARDFKIPHHSILSGKRRAYFSFANFWDALKVFVGIIQAFFILITFRPEVIFAKGGYVTVPIIFWLKFFKIPLVIHESDVVMGRANLWASKKAQKICLGFPIEFYHQKLPQEKLVNTGIPLDADFFKPRNKDSDGPRILITGGSQGSSKINEMIFHILPQLVENADVWHLTGEKDFEKLYRFRDPHYHPIKFSYEMPQLMKQSDLIISRAGASTLAEIAACAAPSIIIPLPSAASNHQLENARVFARTDAIVLLEENDLSPGTLKTKISELLSDKSKLEALARNIRRFESPDATKKIVDIIEQAVQK